MCVSENGCRHTGKLGLDGQTFVLPEILDEVKGPGAPILAEGAHLKWVQVRVRVPVGALHSLADVAQRPVHRLVRADYAVRVPSLARP